MGVPAAKRGGKSLFWEQGEKTWKNFKRSTKIVLKYNISASNFDIYN